MDSVGSWWATAVAVLALASVGAASHTVDPPETTGTDGFYTLDGTIAFDFEDISSTGTALTFDGKGNAHVEGPIALPEGFEFRFYEDPKEEFWVATRGYVAFSEPAGANCCTISFHLPSTHSSWGPAADFVAGTGGFLRIDDLAGGCGDVYFEERTEPRRFIIQYNEACISSSGSTTTWQVKLFHKTNHVEVHYDHIGICNGTCITDLTGGIEDAAEARGLTYFVLKGYGTTKGLAVRYAYPNQPPVASPDGDEDENGIVDDDAYTMPRTQADLLLDVLANDSDNEGDTLTIAALTQPGSGIGTVTVEDGKVRYALDASHPTITALGYAQSVTDVFTYTIDDGNDAQDTASVTVRIDGTDEVPEVTIGTPLVASEAHAGAVPVALTTTHIDVLDPDDPADTVVLRLVEMPVGTLTIDGAPATVDATITRTVLADPSGRIRYEALASDPIGSPPHDRIGFKVYDPDNESALAFAGGATQWVDVHVVPWDDPPTIAFSILPGPYYAGVPIAMWDQSQSGDEPITSWTWDFGDGGSGTGPAIDHAYATAGTYVIRLTIQEGEHVVSQELSLEVYPYVASQAAFHSDRAVATTGEPVRFFDTSEIGTVPIVHREWDFQDARPLRLGASSATVVHAFTEPGTYTVTLTLRDALGISYSAQHEIIVQVPEDMATRPSDPLRQRGSQTTADAGADEVAVQGTIVLLEGVGGGTVPLQMDWRQVSGPEVLLTPAGPGRAYVSMPFLTVQDEVALVFELRVKDATGDTASDKRRIVLTADGNPSRPPVAAPTAGFTIRWEGDLAVLSAMDPGAPGATFTWDFGDGATGSGKSVRHRFSDAGPYEVQLRVVDLFGREAVDRQTVEYTAPAIPVHERADAPDSSGPGPTLWAWVAGITVAVAAAAISAAFWTAGRSRP